jgi:SmpA / OmlA family
MKFKVMLIALLFLAGCGSDRKWAQIQPGMSRQQVVAILGQPNGYKLQNDGEILRYSDDNRYVKFRNGRVVEFGEE